MSLDCWRKVEYSTRWKPEILDAACYETTMLTIFLLFTSNIRGAVFLMNQVWLQADCLHQQASVSMTNLPKFHFATGFDSIHRIQWMDWRDVSWFDDSLPGSPSLIRQLFTEITVKRSTSLTTLWIYLLLLRVDHHQSVPLSPEMNDWCGFGPCQFSHLQSLNPLQKPWVISHHTGSRARWQALQDLSVI